MKIVRCTYENNTFYGVLRDGMIYPVEGDIYGSYTICADGVSPERVQLLPPCEPTKIVAVGLNYSEHAKEMQEAQLKTPVLFLKPTTALLPPNGVIRRPQASERVDYEAELAVVIGKTCSHVTEEAAADYILGYTCCNDVTARDLQKADGQWTRAKGFDTFAPLGPWIETELDPRHLEIRLEVNGIVRQHGNTDMMLFSPFRLVSFISGVMTLLPGDVIITGTPSGIGPLSSGDTASVMIENIGTLTNYME